MGNGSHHIYWRHLGATPTSGVYNHFFFKRGRGRRTKNVIFKELRLENIHPFAVKTFVSQFLFCHKYESIKKKTLEMIRENVIDGGDRTGQDERFESCSVH